MPQNLQDLAVRLKAEGRQTPLAKTVDWEVVQRKTCKEKMTPEQTALNLWGKAALVPETGCLVIRIAPGSKYANFKSRLYPNICNAHKAAWVLAFGDILDGLWVLHRCDNGACINPEHLFLGTPSDNVQDMISKKRNRPPIGIRNGRVKLSESTVRMIKTLHATGIGRRRIGKLIGVNIGTVGSILHAGRWKHILP